MEKNYVADKALNVTAVSWFLVAAIGQWIFVYYVAVYYGSRVIKDGLAGLQNTRLPAGYIEGDTLGNISVAAHLFIAVIIIGGGLLQLIPAIRSRYPVFHHWNGRIYMSAAVLTSLAGLYLTWTRQTIGDLSQGIGISLDAVLIIIFAALTLRYAIARNIKAHRRYALRLFIVVSAVWFYRVGLMLWIVLNGGPVGFDPKTFTGPFLSFISFAQYLIPLAVLELYLRAKDGRCSRAKFAMVGLLAVCTASTAFGVFAATTGMWLPRL